ncbi:MAG: phosphoribosylformimino-5-aminoimidazole carboxamide ribotide isomerase [Lachnospiraceae bacterium]|nr:phosphoribosylformimino-5-aminoimidazole carboxamide ribotide isomerase [Lachnospiraceae bacterium]
MKFRPCIDIHNGQVKQIVGGSLTDAGNQATENYVSEQDAAFYAHLYKESGIAGGHIILLNKAGTPEYEADIDEAGKALREYPKGLQIGGGVNADNAKAFIDMGASHVIVTSYVFREGKIDYERLDKLVSAVGKERLVLDLSCRRKGQVSQQAKTDNTVDEANKEQLHSTVDEGQYYIVTDRWQRFTEEPLTKELLSKLSSYADEFLVHAVDVEGKASGVEQELVSLLADSCDIPITYAGGVGSYEDIELIRKLGNGRIDVTIGSALDLFGGTLEYDKVLSMMDDSDTEEAPEYKDTVTDEYIESGKQGRGVWSFVKNQYVYVLTFIFAFAMMAGAWIIGDVGPFGGKCLVVVDGVHQYLPFFSEYQEKLTHLSDIQYTFDVGMGNNFISLWSYYLSSPFNLIIMLCSKSHLPMALNIIISTKIILAALCFAYFLMHYWKKPSKDMGVVAFSLLYAFSSYVVGYYWNLMWLDCIFIFPIIILGMKKMLNEKDSRLYVLALLYAFICNYYISFMICMFLVLWFFTFSFKSVSDFFFKGVRFAVASITTAMLSAVVLLPAYKGIMTTASAEFELPEWEFYGTFADTLRSHLFCSEVLTNQIGDAGTNLYCGMLTILFAVVFFLMPGIKAEKKVKYLALLALFVVSFNNIELNYIWHGFHNQYGIPNRFAFLYIFVLLLMAYEVYRKREGLKWPMVIISYTISMLFVIFCYFNAETIYDDKTYMLSALLLTLYMVLLVLFCMAKGARKPLIIIVSFVAIFEMAINGLYGFYQDGSSEPDYYYGDTEAVAELRKRNGGLGDDNTQFYREDVLQPLFVDEATWHNLKSVGIFGSTVRGEMVDIMGDLGFYTGANEYLYYGATPVTNALFGVKYVYTRRYDFVNVDTDMIKVDSQESPSSTVSVYENPNILPVGYMVNEDILDFETYDNGPFTVQNELCGALTGIEPIFVSILDDMKVNVYGTNMDIELIDDNNAKYSNANPSARGDMIYTVPHDMDLYVSTRGSNIHKVAILIDGTEVGYDRYHGQLCHIGDLKAGQLVDIQFELGDNDDMDGELYCYPMEFKKDQFRDFYNVMLNRGMQVETVSDTKITGKVSAKDGEVFMTSIPYDDGWSVYCDGDKVETLVLLDGFLGADIPSGEHEIKLVFRSPGSREGLLLTLAGVVFFLILIYSERGKKERKSASQ